MDLFKELHGDLSPKSFDDERGLIFMSHTENFLVNSFGYTKTAFPISAFTKEIEIKPVPNNSFRDYIALISLESTSYKVYALDTHNIDSLFQDTDYISDYTDLALSVSKHFKLLLNAPYETYDSVPFGSVSYEELYAYLSKLYEIRIQPAIDRHSDNIRNGVV